ncbi:MAG: nicotinate-nucleotide--dimethylbenzimidazole phosphoribosyltransferase [Alphaproteobacteria bacterium HGW-Alphaproteobacteria-11]|nr:MAG: nicotinate-nucleotide--dimethylbenzimidazole phosphoribosyltransferase [Alphaproteobacteria bacterium HGW-Alphaproteobacteria-11]
MTRAATGLPFDDIRNLLAGLPQADEDARAAARAQTRDLAAPEASLGRLAEIAEWMAAWAASPKPAVTRPLVAIFAATHGLAAADPDAGPADATHRLVELYAAGGAAVNQIALQTDAGLKVFDLALDMPTPDIRVDAALSEAACAATMAFGMEAIAGGTDLLCIGAAGAGNRTVAAALTHALFDGTSQDWTDGSAWGAEAVTAALAQHEGHLADPLEALRRVGGREFAAIAGAILAARYQRIPVLLDGIVACAAAAVLHRLAPGALDHCLAAHASGEPAHARLLEAIGKTPLLETGIALEEGAGAALAIGLVKSALAVHGGMATQAQL